jgi:hypothetical protein
MEELKKVIDTLRKLDVSSKTEKKNKLTYLSWTWAWDEVIKHYPMASYQVVKQDSGLPYVYDPNTGYMVYTKVTIEELTHEMWLPVMDGANKAMKSEPYKYETRYNGEKTVEAATMFDINKTIMRCLVKNLAMFGLGLYIYSGEDLPEQEPKQLPKITPEAYQKAIAAISEKKVTLDQIKAKYSLSENQEKELSNL